MELMELVHRAQSGDNQAYAEVCRRFDGLVKKQAHQQHLRAIYEDAVAEGRLAVAEAVMEYNDAAGGRFAGFVNSKVRYALWNLFKRERRRWERENLLEGDERQDANLPLARVADGVDVAAEAERSIVCTELNRALAQLSDKQRQAILRTVVGAERLTEVAACLGVTPQAVHNLNKRGLARLKILCTGM